MAVNIQLRRGTAAEWTAANPTLAVGEIGIETDTDKFKIGNGADDWATRPYGGLQGADGADGAAGVVAASAPITYDSGTQTVGIDEASISIATTQLSDFLTTAAPSTVYGVVNNGSIAYTIDGTDNPTLSLMRGQKYVFDVNATGHPFHIQTVDGAYDSNNLYTDGVTGQGTEVGQVVIEVPLDAPSTLYYVCQFHSGMQGQINVADLDEKAPLAQPLNAQSAAYTLQASDNGAVIKASGTTTITVPDAVFSAGERVDIINTGSGVITIAAGSGVTLLSKESLVTLDAQYKAASIIFDTASQAFLIGDIA